MLELGRDYGNSTSVFTEAAQSIRCRVVSIGFDSEHAWETRTAPRLSAIVEPEWFTPLLVIQNDITTIDFRPLLAGSTRAPIFWDAHGTDVARTVFGRLVAALPFVNKVVVDDVWSDPEQYGQRAEHRALPLWSLYDEVVPLWDDLWQRGVELESGNRRITFSHRSYESFGRRERTFCQTPLMYRSTAADSTSRTLSEPLRAI